MTSSDSRIVFRDGTLEGQYATVDVPINVGSIVPVEARGNEPLQVYLLTADTETGPEGETVHVARPAH